MGSFLVDQLPGQPLFHQRRTGLPDKSVRRSATPLRSTRMPRWLSGFWSKNSRMNCCSTPVHIIGRGALDIGCDARRQTHFWTQPRRQRQMLTCTMHAAKKHTTARPSAAHT